MIHGSRASLIPHAIEYPYAKVGWRSIQPRSVAGGRAMATPRPVEATHWMSDMEVGFPPLAGGAGTRSVSVWSWRAAGSGGTDSSGTDVRPVVWDVNCWLMMGSVFLGRDLPGSDFGDMGRGRAATRPRRHLRGLSPPGFPPWRSPGAQVRAARGGRMGP